MPKLKTHSSSKKRFKITGTGKVKRNKAYKSHILTKKSSKRKRNLRKSTIASTANESIIKVMLPYK
ncbi:MAG TPA: 50S ribosomal protein L35 [Thermoclostridium sp.]|mgnify:FL=1